MKKIDIQIVSNRPEFLSRCVKSFFSSGLNSIGTISIAAQGDSVPMCASLVKAGYKIRYISLHQEAEPRMTYLRRKAHSFYSEENTDALWGVFDDDHQFKDNAAVCFMDYYEDFKRIEGDTGRYPYMSLAGGLGSYPSMGALVVPPYCLFATGHGLLFHSKLPFLDVFDDLIGGGEDKLLCSFAITTRNTIPMKCWLSPVIRWNRPQSTRKDSFIHDPAIWQDNTYEVIRIISSDNSWRKDLSDWDSKKHGAGSVSEAPKEWSQWAKLFSKLTDKGKAITRETSEAVRSATGF